MIIDKLEHLRRYFVPRSERILQFIAEHDCAGLSDGEIEIEGRELFVRVMSYTPKPAEENRFEIHHVYADLQYIVKAVEVIQTADEKDLSPITPYDDQSDFQFFKPWGLVNNLAVFQGQFVVFYPHEAHRPGCAYTPISSPVKKLVFKIKMGP